MKGTKSGAGVYSFKNDRPSKSMVDAIREYLSRSKRSTSSVKKYSGHGKHERKNKSLAQYDSAYAVARSIKQKGIKATGFLDKAVNATSRKVGERLGAALRIDIINSLQ